jgi:rhodanese-related sulfurtransferase
MFALPSVKGSLPRSPHPTHSGVPPIAPPLPSAAVPEISIHELEQWLTRKPEDLILIDVRNFNEYENAYFLGSVLVPLPTLLEGDGIAQIKATIARWQKKNGTDRPYNLIVYCAKGVRSATAIELLQQEGIVGLNLAEGIKAWQKAIQPANPNYLFEKSSSMPLPSRKRSVARSKSIRLAALALMAIGTIGWGTYKINHNPDRLRPLLAAGVPLKILEPLPFLGRAVQAAELPQITVQALQQKMDRQEDYLLVDVRSPEEYQTSKIPGAVSIPLSAIEQGEGVEQIQKMLGDRVLILYCTAGYRSATALLKLKQLGLQGIQVKGGMNDWYKEIESSAL